MTGIASFFTDLSIVIVVAAAVSLVFSRFNLPLTVGYILAGVVVGPNFGPTLITNNTNIRMLSDLGVMFLMFSIGLGFSFRKVRQAGGGILFPAIWDVTFMVLGGFLIGMMLGWGNLECFLLGLILCDSSTSIAAKTLESLGWLGKRFAGNTFAIALIEDVLAILLIAILNGVTGGSGGDSGTVSVVVKQLCILALFLVGVIVFGILLVPRIMNWVTDRFDDEIVLMAALGICFGISCLAQSGLGLSLVVGAFLSGVIIAESRARRRIERTVKPVTNLFAAVFFVSVGLVMEPLVIRDHIGTILFVTLAMIVLKVLNNTVACFLIGEHPRDAFKVGLGMGQVAEFSFIIAGIAMTGGLTALPLYQIAIGIALLCTATNPYLLRMSDSLYDAVVSRIGPETRSLLRWYRRWITSLRLARQRNGEETLSKLNTLAILFVVDGIVIAILFTGIVYFARIPAVAEFLARLNEIGWLKAWHLNGGALLCMVLALLVSAPAFWAAWHLWGRISASVAEAGFLASEHRLQLVRRFIRTVMRLVGQAVIVAYAALLCSVFVRNMWIVALAIFLFGLLASRFSRRFRRGCEESHKALVRAFDLSEMPPEAPESINTLIAVHTETAVVPQSAAVVGKTLGELNFRAETGAAILSVRSRAGEMNVSPGRETPLRAGDSIVLVGSDAELSRAIAFLTQKRHPGAE